MTFRERYMAGEAAFDEIFDLTDEWMASDEECTLAAYLGLNAREEDIWISDSDEALEDFMEKEKTRKALFTDLDDTLLTRSKLVTPGNRAAIDQLLTDDNYFVLTTGRVFPSALQVAKKYKFIREGCFIVCGNGAETYDTARKKFIRRQSLEKSITAKACQLAKDFGIFIQGYSETHVLTETDGDVVKKYCEVQGLPYTIVENLADCCGGSTPKLLAIDWDAEKAAAFRQLALKELNGMADVFTSNPYYIEIVPKGVSKGSALEQLCYHLGIPVSQSISAGDEENDIPMIKAAGHGCAVNNALDSVKAVADYVTQADCDHDAIAEILEKFV